MRRNNPPREENRNGAQELLTIPEDNLTRDESIEIGGLDEFKKQTVTAKVFQILGASGLIYYFIQSASYNSQVNQSPEAYDRAMQSYRDHIARGGTSSPRFTVRQRQNHLLQLSLRLEAEC